MDQLRLHGLLSRENRVNTNGSKFRRFLAGASGVILLLLSACAVKKPPSTTQTVNNALPPATKIPEQWTAQGTSAAPVETGWLKSFNDPQMEALVTEALKNNLDLQAAATRVQVAANIVTEVHAQMMPMIGVAGSGSYLGRFHQTNDKGKVVGNFNASSLLGGVSWELDVW